MHRKVLEYSNFSLRKMLASLKQFERRNGGQSSVCIFISNIIKISTNSRGFFEKLRVN
jgi:hypothetical protein